MLVGALIGAEPTVAMFEDNAGSTYLLRNPKTGSRTKHIEIRHLLGRQLFQQQKAMPCFARSEENVADGLAKNQPEKLFSEHEDTLMNGHFPDRRQVSVLLMVVSLRPDDLVDRLVCIITGRRTRNNQ